VIAAVAHAQTAPPAQEPEAARPHPAEPDFKVVALPTTLAMPAGKWNFTMAHRFNGNLRAGSFTDQLEGLFGLDSGASIGLELRWAPASRVQAVILRTNIDRTIQFSGKFDAIRQNDTAPVSLSPFVAVEGALNFRVRRQPAVGAVVSRTIGDALALYVVPAWVHNTTQVGADRNTTIIGLGGRWQFRTRTFLVVEASPRVAGFKAGETMYGFGIEKRVGGHVFQLNFTNTHAATFGQIARGGFPNTLYLGFNLSRKFY
jgi:hypothetical protein